MDAVAALGAQTETTRPNAFSDLTSEEFVKIMFTELQSQDPLQPSDSAKLLEQMSSLRSIQSDMELSRKIESLVSQNQLATAGGLIGRYITGLSEQNNRVEGLVLSVSRTNDGPVLNLHTGVRVPFRNVDEMIDPGAFSGTSRAPSETPEQQG